MPIIHDQEATSGRELTNPGSSLNCDPRSWDINTSAPLPHGHNSWKIRVLHWLSEFLSKVKLKSPRVIVGWKNHTSLYLISISLHFFKNKKLFALKSLYQCPSGRTSTKSQL
jgi:hypothetical protein